MSDPIKIESDIPVPASKGKYPFRQMKVGDSIFIPNMNSSSQISGSFGQLRKAGFKFLCRKLNGGIRVWRIE
jgi:hypothetical protein